MKNTTKRILAGLLAALMLGTAVACTGNDDPADTDESVGSDTTQTVTDGNTAESETEPETEPLPEDFVVTEENGAATVLTPAGLTYTVTGYTAADGGIFTFTDELTVSLAHKSLEESFNRFTMHYSSDKPLRMFVTYGSKEDDYYLEAGSGDFSGLISGFMAKENGEKLTSIRIKSCVDGAASFSLTSLTTEQWEVPEETFFIENDRFKLGVALHMGGGINYLEDKKDGDPRLASLINQHDGGRLLVAQVLDALLRTPVILHPHPLPFVVDEAIGMRTESVHVAVTGRDSAVGHDDGHLVQRLGQHGPEVPVGLW